MTLLSRSAATHSYADSRILCAARLLGSVEQDLRNPDTLASQVYHALQQMIRVRKAHPAFSAEPWNSCIAAMLKASQPAHSGLSQK